MARRLRCWRRRSGDDLGVLRGPFDAMICRAIVRFAIPVGVAIGLVVPVLVADEIGQREAVMRRHEVDARVGPPAVLLVEIALPVKRLPKSASVPGRPRQTSRTVSR